MKGMKNIVSDLNALKTSGAESHIVKVYLLHHERNPRVRSRCRLGYIAVFENGIFFEWKSLNQRI